MSASYTSTNCGVWRELSENTPSGNFIASAANAGQLRVKRPALLKS
jgi:hypothetical protein